MSVPPASTVTIRTPSAANPNACAFRLLRLAVNSVAATTGTVDNATCTTMRVLKAAPPTARLRPLDDRVSRRFDSAGEPRRGHTNAQSSQHRRGQREQQHVPVRMHLQVGGKSESRQEPDQSIDRPGRDEHTECAARHRYEEAFRKQLARQSPAAGAERQADREIRAAAPPRAPETRYSRFAHASTSSTATITSIACTGLPYRSRNSGGRMRRVRLPGV